MRKEPTKRALKISDYVYVGVFAAYAVIFASFLMTFEWEITDNLFTTIFHLFVYLAMSVFWTTVCFLILVGIIAMVFKIANAVRDNVYYEVANRTAKKNFEKDFESEVENGDDNPIN